MTMVCLIKGYASFLLKWKPKTGFQTFPSSLQKKLIQKED